MSTDSPNATAHGDTVRLRFEVIEEHLAAGRSRAQIIADIQQEWQLSLRSAQWYVKTTIDRVSQQRYQYGEQTYAYRLCQLRRDNLLRRVLQCAEQIKLDETDAAARFAKLVPAACKLMAECERASGLVRRITTPGRA